MKYIFDNIKDYEAGERILIEKFNSRGDKVVQAFTTIGFLTGLISKLVGEEGEVISVEAIKNLARIAKSLNRNCMNISFINAAIVFDDHC